MLVRSSLILDTVLIDMYCKCRKVEDARRVFERMVVGIMEVILVAVVVVMHIFKTKNQIHKIFFIGFENDYKSVSKMI